MVLMTKTKTIKVKLSDKSLAHLEQLRTLYGVEDIASIFKFCIYLTRKLTKDQLEGKEIIVRERTTGFFGGEKFNDTRLELRLLRDEF